jgi:putative transposase
MALAPQTVRTFFVTSVTWNRCALLQSDRMAGLLVDCLADNRKKGRFQLHEFVVMPNHFHLLMTPSPQIPLEKAVQFLKGGFSYRARKELRFNSEIWQPGFTNHRIQDGQDYDQHRRYIHHNPVERRLSESPEDFLYSSAHVGWELDPRPPWLKPKSELSALVRSA